MSDMPREIWAYPGEDDFPAVWNTGEALVGDAGTPYILKSEHAKLEAANKVLREALEIIRQECLSNTKRNDRLARENCGYVAEEAIKAADEIEKE